MKAVAKHEPGSRFQVNTAPSNPASINDELSAVFLHRWATSSQNSFAAWAIEGTSGHGAGLSRHLLASSELVIEADRPKRAARRNGAKSDPLDAIRAAREAMA